MQSRSVVRSVVQSSGTLEKELLLDLVRKGGEKGERDDAEGEGAWNTEVSGESVGNMHRY